MIYVILPRNNDRISYSQPKSVTQMCEYSHIFGSVTGDLQFYVTHAFSEQAKCCIEVKVLS